MKVTKMRGWVFKGKILLHVPALLKEGVKNKGERQGRKQDKEHMGKEMPLWGWTVSGARGGAARMGAAVSPHVPVPLRPPGSGWSPGSQALGIAVRQEVLSSPHMPGASSSGADTLAGLIGILQRFPR